MEMEGQEQLDESGLPGPGAPTPLSALDVSECIETTPLLRKICEILTELIGRLGFDWQRYQTLCGCRLSHRRGRGLHVRIPLP
jgi:hypothetical protein